MTVSERQSPTPSIAWQSEDRHFGVIKNHFGVGSLYNRFATLLGSKPKISVVPKVYLSTKITTIMDSMCF